MLPIDQAWHTDRGQNACDEDYKNHFRNRVPTYVFVFSLPVLVIQYWHNEWAGGDRSTEPMVLRFALSNKTCANSPSKVYVTLTMLSSIRLTV